MGFGTDGPISRNTNGAAQTADKIDGDGSILETTTHGATEEITEEGYTDAFVNEAVNGQIAETGAGVVTAHSLNEVNTDYARETKTTRYSGDSLLTTTTTTTA